VAALLVSAREPDVVLRALDMRYGRPELVVADFAIFASRVRNCVEVICLLDRTPTEYLAAPELFQAIISKILPLLRAQWLDYAARYEASGSIKARKSSRFLAPRVSLRHNP
jgi:hypothetical protein